MKKSKRHQQRFSITSHISWSTGKPKIDYKSPERAKKAAQKMNDKNPGEIYSFYECPYCGGYHIGREDPDYS